MKRHPGIKLFTIFGLTLLILSLSMSPVLDILQDRQNALNSWGNLASLFSQKVEAQSPQTVYVATTKADCGNFSPCYPNTDGVNGANGQGTGLRDAVNALTDGDTIIILGTYLIKDHTVLIDKDLTIQGQENSIINYNGTDCSNPMLSLISGGTLKDLTMTGGDCGGLSRDLIEINTSQDIIIEHNTLKSGNRAIDIKDNDGTVSAAFNQITDNLEYAIFQGKGVGTGSLNIYANNIHNNRAGSQVNCNNQGSADHNFWGEGVLATEAAEFCGVSDQKMLGAPILTLPNTPGVEAVRQRVSDAFAYAFENKIGVKRNSGNDYDLIIVNHGQGTEDNIPFLETGATPIVACSNFYDVFLTDGANASDLVISLKYDLNSDCIAAVESTDFCDQNEDSKYPLWWYDPADNLTDGWDRTGQIPAGNNPLNISGQKTTCNLSTDALQVVIDDTGRPGIEDDLFFTPFVAGLPVGSSDITTLNVYLIGDEVYIEWKTGIESKISGYHVLRSELQSGPYNRISPLITSFGSNAEYDYTDTLNSTEFDKTYFYKIEIVNIYGETIRTHGPQSILTSTPTPTLTLTRTPTLSRTPYPTRTPYPSRTPVPTHTATQYIYRTPTSLYRPRTATPFSTPTKVRTDRPTPTNTQTLNADQIQQTESALMTGTAQSAGTPTPSATTDAMSQLLSVTPSLESESGEDTQVPTATQQPTKTSTDNVQELGNSSWVYLLIGAGSGFGVLAAAGFFLSKHYFN